MPITWTKNTPSVYTFTGTNGAGGDYTFDLVHQGGGQFAATFKKEGVAMGSAMIFETIDQAKDVFAAVAANIP